VPKRWGLPSISESYSVIYERKEMSEKWDRRFLEVAKLIASWSKDPSTKVGAVIVNNQNLIVGTGYNGFPRGVTDDGRLNDRPSKYALIVHAEANAILLAGKECRGARLYVWPTFFHPPICNECCKLAIQAGIAEIIGYEKETGDKGRWKDAIAVSRQMCTEAGIRWRSVDEGNDT
jgi:dCMP deaminase